MNIPVESKGQFLNHLASVLGSVAHGRHARRLFGTGSFLHGVEQHGGEGKLHVVLDDVRVYRVVSGEFWGVLEMVNEVLSSVFKCSLLSKIEARLF